LVAIIVAAVVLGVTSDGAFGCVYFFGTACLSHAGFASPLCFGAESARVEGLSANCLGDATGILGVVGLLLDLVALFQASFVPASLFTGFVPIRGDLSCQSLCNNCSLVGTGAPLEVVDSLRCVGTWVRFSPPRFHSGRST
jgi:hypothetical protein